MIVYFKVLDVLLRPEIMSTNNIPTSTTGWAKHQHYYILAELPQKNYEYFNYWTIYPPQAATNFVE